MSVQLQLLKSRSFATRHMFILRKDCLNPFFSSIITLNGCRGKHWIFSKDGPACKRKWNRLHLSSSVTGSTMVKRGRQPDMSPTFPSLSSHREKGRKLDKPLFYKTL